ncbi:MAG: PDZ domain-containing protein [Oscillospiraceae bacterium]|jgi:carboxyl-terminal processing protease|nr:PDZ domain-containing protein [Oscillospiraceae bacterium]
MNKKISLGLSISITIIAVTLAVVVTYTAAMNTFDSRMSSVTERQNMYDLLSELDLKVRMSYYKELRNDAVSNSIAKGYVDGLGDPYSGFLTSEQYKQKVDLEAGYDFGLGIDIARNSDGLILVNRVDSNSPANSAGVKKGDVITSVGGKSVSSTGYDSSVAALSEASPKASFAVKRNGRSYNFNVTKSTYSVMSIERKVIGDDTGYIRISEFNDKTYDQFNSAVNSLKKSQITGLIIDLRDNKGGSYDAACEILDSLLPAGNLMLTKAKDGEETVMYTSDTRDLKMPMCILINSNTIGAGELFAGAFADFGRADLVGTATFGRHSVQELFPLSNGTAVELTTKTWTTASSSALEGGKIAPHFEVKLTDYQYENRFLLSDGEDPQLQTAIERIESKKTATPAAPAVSDSDAE